MLCGSEYVDMFFEFVFFLFNELGRVFDIVGRWKRTVSSSLQHKQTFLRSSLRIHSLLSSGIGISLEIFTQI